MAYVWSTDPVYYTIMYRRKGSRRFYRCGYRSVDVSMLHDMAQHEICTGKYAGAKIVKWDNEEIVEEVL